MLWSEETKVEIFGHSFKMYTYGTKITQHITQRTLGSFTFSSVEAKKIFFFTLDVSASTVH